MNWPYGIKEGAHPHGLNYARHWLAWMLDIESLTDVTATPPFNFLEVSGNALMRQYYIQFWKITLSKATSQELKQLPA
ncbi:hypothetical protein EK904_013847, partial [Melospiza melodia maxima]